MVNFNAVSQYAGRLFKAMTVLGISATLVMTTESVNAQSVGISDGAIPTPNTRSLMDIRWQGGSPGKGLLIPRITSAQRAAMTASLSEAAPHAASDRGMLVYQTDGVGEGYWYWKNTATGWVQVLDQSNAAGWLLSGNALTTPGTHYLGTSDGQDLRFKTNGADAFTITNTGKRLLAYQNGTAALPLISWNGDDNMGIYRINTDILGFSTNGIERIRIAADGNVGLGVVDGSNNPIDASERLQVTGNILLSRGATRRIYVQNALGNSDGGNNLEIIAGKPAGVNSAAGGQLLLEAGSGYSGFSEKGGDVVVRSGGNDFSTAAINNGNIVFETGRENAGTGTTKERMRIRNDGLVHIGAYNPLLPPVVSAGQLLYVAGKVKSNGVNETSDARLKKNFNPIGSALNKVLAMNGVTYEWRKEEFPDRNFVDGTQYGMIAQELEKIIPELVDTDSEGWKSIEYSHIVPVLIEAIKEQQAIIAVQQQEITSLQSMKDELNTLKASIELLNEHLKTSQK